VSELCQKGVGGGYVVVVELFRACLRRQHKYESHAVVEVRGGASVLAFAVGTALPVYVFVSLRRGIHAPMLLPPSSAHSHAHTLGSISIPQSRIAHVPVQLKSWVENVQHRLEDADKISSEFAEAVAADLAGIDSFSSSASSTNVSAV
jgi:hypothetical protein